MHPAQQFAKLYERVLTHNKLHTAGHDCTVATPEELNHLGIGLCHRMPVGGPEKGLASGNQTISDLAVAHENAWASSLFVSILH